MATGDVHVTPVGDSFEHETSEDCPCGPHTEAVFREDGSNGWMYLHHRFDRPERRQ